MIAICVLYPPFLDLIWVCVCANALAAKEWTASDVSVATYQNCSAMRSFCGLLPRRYRPAAWDHRSSDTPAVSIARVSGVTSNNSTSFPSRRRTLPWIAGLTPVLRPSTPGAILSPGIRESPAEAPLKYENERRPAILLRLPLGGTAKIQKPRMTPPGEFPNNSAQPHLALWLD